ncbi:hypothetical protein HAX54_013166, partial [Datura stramonium]|nr:hypothetical protein [Datura stramonium]
MISIRQPQWAISRGLIHHLDLTFEARMWLDLDACPLFRPLDRTVWADSVITLASKTDKDAPAMKRAKCTENRTPPPPSASSYTSTVQLDIATVPTPTPPDLLNVAQKAQSEVCTLRKKVAALSGPPSTSNQIQTYSSACTPRDTQESSGRLRTGGVAITSYNELNTLPDRWVVPGPGKP